MTSQKMSKVDYWVNQLADVELPVLSGVMQELNAVTQSDDSCAAQLSEIILKDSALTTKVLRIANSVHYNPSSDNPVTTISRAVVQLGFHSIKAISLSVMLIDSLLKQSSRARMLQCMARSFHCAVQAENLLKMTTGNDREEDVFITALLLHVGDMAFWSAKSDISDQLESRIDEGETNNLKIEKELLGCTLREVSCGLAKQWHLGEELQMALSPYTLIDDSSPSSSIATAIAEEISLVTEQGWESPAFENVIDKVSAFTGLGLKDARSLIERGADKAASVALTYGANKICHLIPNANAAAIKPENIPLKADPKLQLGILREMATMVEQRVEVNTLFQVVVEGIHRSVGLERVALCLTDPTMSTLSAKYILGDDTDEWRSDMNFSIKSDQDNLFAYGLHSHKTIMLPYSEFDDQPFVIDQKSSRLIDVDNCLMSAIYAGDRPIGLIVADKGVRDPVKINEDQRDSFEHFAQQINMTLPLLAKAARKN